jgi:hypothetical protein
VFQGLDWLEVLWRGVRTLFGYHESDRCESFSTGYNVAAAMLVVVVLIGVLGIIVLGLTN